VFLLLLPPPKLPHQLLRHRLNGLLPNVLLPLQALEPEVVICLLFLPTHQVDLVLPSKDISRLFHLVTQFVDLVPLIKDT
jgi:hypothetical protein